MNGLEAVPDFAPEQSGEYWQKRWEQGYTGWKSAEESKPFEKFMTLTLEAAGRPTTDLAAVLKGKRVFVPLCGDTYALRFFFELGCHVVGVDLAGAALKVLRDQWFPQVAFTETQHGPDGFVEHSLVAPNGGSVRLIEGDIFAVMDKLFPNVVFDVVYDRASLMAIHPSLREPYLSMMRRVFRKPQQGTDATTSAWLPVMYVDMAVWPKQLWGHGPPFYFEEPLGELYPEADGYRNKIIEDCDMALIALLERGEPLPEGARLFQLRHHAVWITDASKVKKVDDKSQ